MRPIKQMPHEELFPFVKMEALILENHILRQINRDVDFSFIDELVDCTYSKDTGRPVKEPAKSKRAAKRRKVKAGICDRIEGAFGVGKRRFGLGLVMTKLRETSETRIGMIIFVMNITRWLRDIFFLYAHRIQINAFITPIRRLIPLRERRRFQIA